MKTPKKEMDFSFRTCRWKLFWLVFILTVNCQKHVQPKKEELPSLSGLVSDPKRIPSMPADQPESVSVSHILSSYQGALKARARFQRTRQQARSRALHLLALARSEKTDFMDLARRFSDDPDTSTQGGDLGVVITGQLHPDLERAAFGLEVSQVSEVVETPYGFHILYRQDPTEAQATEIVVAYIGALNYKPRKPRTQQQAKKLAFQILQRLQNGADFKKEAMAYSDLDNYNQGGFHPVFKKGTKNPKFEEIVWNLKEGQVSNVIETKTGFHIVKRIPVEKVYLRQVTLNYRPDEAELDVVGSHLRKRSEALSLAQEIYQEAKTLKQDFASLVTRFSEEPGKELGPFTRGKLSFPIEEVAFSLKPGEISEVLDLRKSFVIVKRIY